MRAIYQKLVPYEMRYWLYKLRHPQEFGQLRKAVYQSPKGDFSLRSYDQIRCIFVHITKTAGTSVAKSLFGEMPYHYTASEYRVIYGRKTFNSYFKFAFVRNPWDRLHSAYTYLKKGGWNDDDCRWANENLSEIDEFNQFVLEWLNKDRLHDHIHFWPQMDFISDSRGRPLIDTIAYFETIAEDHKDIAAKLGIQAELAHVNASEKTDYRLVYTPEAIEKVRQLYMKDVENFGYSFDSFQRMTIRDRKFTPVESNQT